MEITRFNNGFLPSFLSGFEDEVFNKRQAMKFSKVAVNIIERNDDYVVEMAVPGINKDDIHIELDGTKFSIRGEGKESKEESEDNYTLREFSYGEFTRSFTLPKDVDVHSIAVDYTYAVLKVCVPKPEAKNKTVEKIDVESSK